MPFFMTFIGSVEKTINDMTNRMIETMWMLPLQVMKRHAACNCPYHAYVDATCASVEKMINDMTDRMIETMKERITE